MQKKRYAIVGVSNRALSMFMDPILKDYADCSELVAMLDKDQARLTRYNQSRGLAIPEYLPEQFDRMIAETKPDVVIVACHDGLHHHYIIGALKHDLDVVSEKPLTIDAEKCAAIARAEAAGKGKVRVTFNYRYGPQSTKIKELIAAGKIGHIDSVDLNWYLDTYHGGSDPLLRDELFRGPDLTAPVARQADLNDGIEAVLTGVAIHRSITEGQSIKLEEMREKVFGDLESVNV